MSNMDWVCNKKGPVDTNMLLKSLCRQQRLSADVTGVKLDSVMLCRALQTSQSFMNTVHEYTVLFKFPQRGNVEVRGFCLDESVVVCN